jgi:ribosomal 30S subunit maturation factor RimM
MVDFASRDLIGTVTGWQELGGPVVLELDAGRILVPYASEMLREINLSAREIRACLPDGLVNLNSS